MPVFIVFLYLTDLHVDALTSDPNNAMKQKNFRENLKFFQDACTGVEGATRGPNNLRFKTRKETQQINSLARAARAGDAKGVVQCAREAAATQMEIVVKARYPKYYKRDDIADPIVYLNFD